MDRRAFVAAFATASVFGTAGCIGSFGRPEKPPSQRTYEQYVDGGNRLVSFRSYVSFESAQVTADGERVTLTPDNDVFTIVTASIENVGEESISTPLLNEFELIAAEYKPYHPSSAINGVDLNAIQPPEQDKRAVHLSDADPGRPHPEIEPGREIEYNLLFDTTEPSDVGYLLKWYASDYEAGVNVAKPVYLVTD
ncbi:hypothetical protein [Halobaculum lipolyticum]|uniref:DUF4352 domain-containing protein n=1 Tax=Halobaculum lipolyticum TaxID=3032001 RepID=A0ABD5WGM3_9EURY|nr:hypothetical protein [Halobaculum sp. DT31]